MSTNTYYPRQKDAAWAIPEDGVMKIYTPDGKLLSPQMMIRVTNDVMTCPIALVKMVVNVGSREEMEEQLAEWEAEKAKEENGGKNKFKFIRDIIGLNDPS